VTSVTFFLTLESSMANICTTYFNIKALLVCVWSRCSTMVGKTVGANGEVRNEELRTSKV